MRIRLRVLLLGGAGALALCAAGAASAFAAGPDTTHATNRPSTAAAPVQEPAITQTGPVVAVHTTMPGGPATAPRTMPVARAVPMHHPAPSRPEGPPDSQARYLQKALPLVQGPRPGDPGAPVPRDSLTVLLGACLSLLVVLVGLELFRSIIYLRRRRE